MATICLVACLFAILIVGTAAIKIDVYEDLRVGKGYKLMSGDDTCKIVESKRKSPIRNLTGKMMANFRMPKTITGGSKSDVVFRVLSHRDQAEQNDDFEYDSDDSASIASSTPKSQHERLSTPVDMEAIVKEMKDSSNLIYFRSNGQLAHPDMHKVIDRIGHDHQIRLLTHGRGDSVDSLHRIHGFGKFVVFVLERPR